MLDLNTPVKREKAPVTSFEPLPEGEYNLKIVSIKNWESKHFPSIVVKRTDTKYENVDVYSCSVKYEVTDEGEYKGRFVFDSLTTHPAVPWIIPSFLDAVGLDELAPSEIPTVCVGMPLVAVVGIKESVKKVTDSNTGLETEVVRLNNCIKSFVSMPEDLGDIGL